MARGGIRDDVTTDLAVNDGNMTAQAYIDQVVQPGIRQYV